LTSSRTYSKATQFLSPMVIDFCANAGAGRHESKNTTSTQVYLI
jgi:hypothetical protein